MSTTPTDGPTTESGPTSPQLPVFLDRRWRRRLGDRLAEDDEFAHVARWTNVTVQLSAPEGVAVLAIEAGQLVDAPAADQPLIHLSAPAARWAKFFDPIPPPWHNDVLGFSRRHDDVQLDSGGETLVRHLRVLSRMWEVARATR